MHPKGVARARFFQIGFSKCGTTAIAEFFNRCGIPCVHYDRGRLALRMRENLAARRPPLEGYDHRYRAFTNMDLNAPDDFFDAFREYDALERAYPEARFILNTRPAEHWIRSTMAHRARRMGRAGARRHYKLRFGTADPGEVAARLRAERKAHHRNVRDAIPPERLLVFDIESDPPERLCDFAGLPRSCARHWRLENPSMNAAGRLIGRLLPLSVKRAVPERMKGPVKRLLRAR